MTIPTYLLDTFTSTQFQGNPTTVCVLEDDISNKLMHEIACELNQPVTAFVPKQSGNGTFYIRYFTVTGEIPACGHATLAAAQVFFELTKVTSLIFETTENRRLPIRLAEDIIFMTYPRFEPVAYPVTKETLNALGIDQGESIGLCRELDSLFLELDPHVLRAVSPNYKLLMESDPTLKEVLITSISDDRNYDFLLRSFCPWIGIDEDPVTGSVHSVLAHFWGNRLQKSELRAYQASARGGEAYVEAFENHIGIGGKVQPVLSGVITL